jgi:hypothetical protein
VVPLSGSSLTEYLTSPSFRDCLFGRSVGPFYVSLTGLGVSPGGFFENGIIQGEISYQPF